MKKLFKSLFVVIAATATFAGCQKEENNAPAAQTKTVEFFANSIDTKTQFGESYKEGTDTKYPTLWTAGDKVKVYLNLSIPSGTSGTENSPEVELLEGTETSASAKFKAQIVDYSPESYTFYAVSPSDAANARTSSRVTVVIPTLQKPLATSPAKNAQIVYAISETTEEMPSSIDMDFHHFTAYGKLSFSNLASTSVSKVKIVAPADVCLSGKWNYLPADGTLAPHSEGTSNEITIETTSTSDIWFACGPVDVSGKTLKFIVTTDDGNLEKEITFPANRKFQSGHVAKFTVDMDGVTVPEPEETTAYYQKVTSTQSDWSGKYLIVYEDGTKAYVFNATDAANGYLSATISNGTIASTSETDAVQVTIESMTGGYSIKTSKGYIYGHSSKNQLNFNSSTKQANTISYSNNSIAITSGRVLQFNSASDQMRFRYYTDGGQKPIQLYKLVDGESGGETPEQPETPATPVLSVTATEVNVGAAAGNGEIAYSVENSVSGTTVSASTTATWITNFSYTTAGKVTFSVSANTGEERSAVVTLTYPGAAESKNVTVKQAAGQSGGDETNDPVTLSVTMTNYVNENNCTISSGNTVKQYKTLKLDDVITLTAGGTGTNEGSFWSGVQWRLYQNGNGKVTVSAVSGYIIESVKFTFSLYKNGLLKSGNNTISSGTMNTVNASSVTYTVGASSGSKGQVRITAIEVVYKKS